MNRRTRHPEEALARHGTSRTVREDPPRAVPRRGRPSASALLAVTALVALTGACGNAAQTVRGPEAPAASEPPPSPPWTTRVSAEHPLVGTIWLVAEGRTGTPDELLGLLVGRDFVLLGEKHDNADHHALQAWVVRALVSAGRRPALAFEMLTDDQAEGLAAWRATSPPEAAGMGDAVGWAESGWPDWALYAPIADAAVRAGLPIRAANLGTETLRAVAHAGLAALPETVRAQRGLDEPLAPALVESLRDELREGHCGHAPEGMLQKLLAVQRARDAAFAAAMTRDGDGATDGAVLVAGTSHARLDRGAPWYLRRLAPGRSVGAVAFLEVVPEWTTPAAYVGALTTEDLPFDAIWFTPRVDDEDPCERFREQLEKMKHP